MNKKHNESFHIIHKMRPVEFTKAVGSGNDFIIVDARKFDWSKKQWSRLSRNLCHRKNGVGADGLLLFLDSKRADFKMRIFNPDGSEAQMCGNGSRCIGLYAFQNGLATKDMHIETMAGIIEASVTAVDMLKVKLTEPKSIELNMPINVDGKKLLVNFINLGVPHTVLFVKDLDRVAIERLGPAIRYNKKFLPSGTNVNFAKVLDARNIMLRTYERGVEAETLSCGTGAAATAVIAALVYEAKSPVSILTKSGERLNIYFYKETNVIKSVYLEGKTALIFKGIL